MAFSPKNTENSSFGEDFLGLMIGLVIWTALMVVLPLIKGESYYGIVLLIFLAVSGIIIFVLIGFLNSYHQLITSYRPNLGLRKKAGLYLVGGQKNLRVVKSHFHGFRAEDAFVVLSLVFAVGAGLGVLKYARPAKEFLVSIRESFRQEISEPVKPVAVKKSRPAKIQNDTKRFTRYDREIVAISKKWGVDPAITKSIIHVESGFKWWAVSPKGAEGLMQLMPPTAVEMGVIDSLDPLQNIEGGVKYYKSLLIQFHGSTTLALAAYNAGPQNVLDYRGIPPFRETKDYVNNIRWLYYNKYRDQLNSQPINTRQGMIASNGKLSKHLD